MELNVDTVTLLHANHTPDGVTFLFRLKNGQLHWHTGDFRFQQSMLDNNPILRECARRRAAQIETQMLIKEPITLHTLYLDTTYCNPKYDLPKQKDAVDAVVKCMEKTRTSKQGGNGSTVYLFGTYTIGKEKVFRGASKHFNQKVVVMDGRKNKILERVMDDYTDIIETKGTILGNQHDMYVVRMSDLSFDKVLSVVMEIHKKRAPSSNRVTRVIGFKPTGWCHQQQSQASRTQPTLPWGSKKKKMTKNVIKLAERRRKVCDVDVTIVSVPYSEHSSYVELRDCVKLLGPIKRILPTVGPFAQRDAMVQMLTKK
jgi:DNA cross-link repair 1A protein